MTDQATWIFLSYHANRAGRKVFSATVSIAIRKGCVGEVSSIPCVGNCMVMIVLDKVANAH
jgi:hypothetical protein